MPQIQCNVVRRCVNPYWPNVLNTLVDFERYGSVPAKLAETVVADQSGPPLIIRSGQDPDTDILQIFNEEYAAGFTKPQDYLILLTYVSRHKDRGHIEQAIRSFWRSKGVYDEQADPSWDSVHSHISENYGPINLAESEDKTQSCPSMEVRDLGDISLYGGIVIVILSIPSMMRVV